MKKNVMLFCYCIICLVFIAGVFIQIRPVITIVNNTGKVLYIYKTESVYGVEPEPYEVGEIVKSRPRILVAGKKFKLTTSFMSLLKKDAEIDVGWRVGGRYEYNSIGGGSQGFILSSTEGVCSVSIEIQSGLNKNIIKTVAGNMCLKKIKAFNYKY